MTFKNTISFAFILLSIVCLSQNIELSESDISKSYDEIEVEDLRFKTNINEVRKLYEYSRSKNYQFGILRGLVAMQRHYLLESNYILSLNYGHQAEEIALKLKNYQMLTASYMYKGDAFTRLGMEKEAKEYLDLSLKNDKKISNNVDKDMLLSSIHTVFGALYSGKKNNDSVVSSYQKALDVIEALPAENMNKLQKTRYFYLLIFNNMNMGSSYSYYHNPPELDKAEFYFLKTLAFSTSHPHEFKIAAMNVYYSVAYFYFIKKDYSKCIIYSEKLLDLEKHRKNPEIRLYAYENLKESYDALNNLPQQNKYLKLYSQLSDSLAKIKNTSILSHTEEKEFETKEEIKYLFIFIIVTGIIALITGLYFYIKNRKLKKKYFSLIKNLEKENSNVTTSIIDNKTEDTEIVKSNISLDKEKELLKKLNAFEESEKFLRKNLTLSYMSNLFNTNPKYLSQLIREHKEQNFSSYINKLRINYITQKLYNINLYREYKISYLAEECGYASPQVFINAFRKETGMTPSYFINELKNQN
ncbi:helix-turn-helix domain-containing protein [Elizabethkingia sp. HX XZB]|uniref:helix-turn-helix domain-containing protein n=1 Tax=Elizabethkingia sp. HX XZB TaxID=3003193 RepID=UPI002A23A2F8|nr:helix-turn-helix domain-containing protein [Elizabethkingia sp. HX XZB]MDX8569366.1 helix-turn-helix domain-containing protein [Elizabethkingia sp. HX XZB]